MAFSRQHGFSAKNLSAVGKEKRRSVTLASSPTAESGA